MVNDIQISNKRCRYYYDGSVYVSDDGTFAALPKTRVSTPLYQGTDGKVYAKDKFGNLVSVEKAVITCFCKPKPKDGKKYAISHKDGNPANCHYKNLEWVLVHYVHAKTPEVSITIAGVDLVVRKDGTVWSKNGKKLPIYDYLFDPEINLDVCIDPYVRVPQTHSIYPKNKDMDDLMKTAGYINGDDAILTNPVILHRDYDRMNFSEDNLEWVEKTDQRYIDYLTKKKAEKHQRNIDLNPGKPLHPGM